MLGVGGSSRKRSGCFSPWKSPGGCFWQSPGHAVQLGVMRLSGSKEYKD
jgi:hypothetical protein